MPSPTVVRLVPYNPQWPELFEREASRIRAALDAHWVTIEHVGSTSVPGLVAKPILDILLVVTTRRMRLCTHPLCNTLDTGYSFAKLNGTSIDCLRDQTLKSISMFFPAIARRLSACLGFGIGCGRMPPIASYIRAPSQHWLLRRGLVSIITRTPKPPWLRLSLHGQWQSVERPSLADLSRA